MVVFAYNDNDCMSGIDIDQAYAHPSTLYHFLVFNICIKTVIPLAVSYVF